MEKKNKLDLEQLSAEISNNLNEIGKEMRKGELTEEEMDLLKNGLEAAEFKAYQIKVNMNLKELSEHSPDLPVRDILIKLLSILRPDTSAKMASQVADYISKEWEKRQLKMAA